VIQDLPRFPKKNKNKDLTPFSLFLFDPFLDPTPGTLIVTVLKLADMFDI